MGWGLFVQNLHTCQLIVGGISRSSDYIAIYSMGTICRYNSSTQFPRTHDERKTEEVDNLFMGCIYYLSSAGNVGIILQ